MMLILTRSEIQKAVTMKDAIESARQAFSSSSAGLADIPLRTQINVTDDRGVMLYMPGYLKDRDALGVKIVSVFLGNQKIGKETIQSIVLLQDTDTGQTLAMMDGVYLTALRTGAASGAATSVLARDDASVVAIFGAGQQARTQLEAMAQVRSIKTVLVYDLSKAAAEAYVSSMREKITADIQWLIAQDPEDAVVDADIIITATVSSVPVFPGKALKAGAHINGIGSYKPSMQELDSETIRRAHKIYVDNRKAALEEAGDLIVPIREGLLTEDCVTGEIGEVFNQLKPGRENDQEITLFKTVGFAALDMIVAQLAYREALAKGFGQVLDITI